MPTAPWVRQRTGSPDAVAGRKPREREAGLLERLGPSEEDVDVDVEVEVRFPTVTEMRERVPEGGISVRDLVGGFKEFLGTEEGRRRFAAGLEDMLKAGGVRFDGLKGVLVPRGKGKRKGEREATEREREEAEKVRREATEGLRRMVQEELRVKTAEEVEEMCERLREENEELVMMLREIEEGKSGRLG